jgi:hypothetical protein
MVLRVVVVLCTLLVIVTAQLDAEQLTAVRALFAGLGCGATCPSVVDSTPCSVFALPSVLNCTDGRVVRISIRTAATVAGSISGSALGALTGLTHLQLAGLNLTTIPTQIGRLTALAVLVLRGSSLTGTVPSQVGNLSNLETLSIEQNRLTGTLPVLDKLTKLIELYIGQNVGLGGNMPAMPTTLRELFAADCAFTALPPNLHTLTALTELFVTQNKLNGALPVLPSALKRCPLQNMDTKETNCLDCPANGTVGIGNCTCTPRTACATSMVSTSTSRTTVSSETATAHAATSTSTVLDPANTTTTASAAAPTSTSSSEFEPWIVGVIVGGAVLAVLLVGLAVCCTIKRRRRADRPPTAEMKQPPQPASEYAAVSVAPRERNANYDNGRMNVDDTAAGASEYGVGRLD